MKALRPVCPGNARLRIMTFGPERHHARLVACAVSLIATIAASTSAGPIHRAIREGDIHKVSQILEIEGADGANAAASGDVTPLHIAAAMDREAICALLAAHGAAVDARTSAGFTPLHWAAARNAVHAARILVDLGAEINAVSQSGITPLHWAATRNATNMVRFLLDSGADIGSATAGGYAPIHWALMGNAGASASMLAEKDADSAPPSTGSVSHSDSGSEAGGRPDTPGLATASGVIPIASIPRLQDRRDALLPLGRDEMLSLVWIPTMRLWAGRFEITNGEFRRFKPDHFSGERDGFSLDESRQPAVDVSWFDAVRFCTWLNQALAPAIPAGTVFRLPTDAEWTAMASCGNPRKYPWGDDWPPAFGNYSDESARKRLTHWSGIAHYDDACPVSCAVERSGTNDWGICGLGGNAWEWCQDSYDASGVYRIRRGGSWDFDGESSLRLSAKGFDKPSARDDTIGFRVVAGPAGPQP